MDALRTEDLRADTNTDHHVLEVGIFLNAPDPKALRTLGKTPESVGSDDPIDIKGDREWSEKRA